MTQVSRMARQAVQKCSVSTRSESSEPTSKFEKIVEKNAFRPEWVRRSVVASLYREKFPFLVMLESNIDFELMTPAQIASIYVAARTQRNSWHLTCAREDALGFAPSADFVESINGYFEAAEAPQHAELSEMRSYFDTFMTRGKNVDADYIEKTFWAAVEPLDVSSLIRDSPIGASTQKTNVERDDLTAFIFRSFRQGSLKKK